MFRYTSEEEEEEEEEEEDDGKDTRADADTGALKCASLRIENKLTKSNRK